ncbi:MAG: hypothetical protein HQK49_15195 [Oligoflexia bacterium]|nr:hypothetical protein [Oligoflexia bacterium]
MLKIFQSILNLILQSFIDKIAVIVKIRLLLILVQLVAGIRLFVIYVTLAIVSAVMCAISLFIGITNMIQQYTNSGHFTYNGLMIFCSIVFVFTLLLFLILISEKFWLKALKIDQMINDVRR